MEVDDQGRPEESLDGDVDALTGGSPGSGTNGAVPSANGRRGDAVHQPAEARRVLSTARAGRGGDAAPSLPPVVTGAEGRPRGAPLAEPGPGAFAAVVVERNDDLASVFGKIDSADSPRVALIAPRGNRELATQLGMRRLQRHLDLSGRDVILVTRARTLRVRAREEGLPTVTSLRRVDFDRRRGGIQLGWMTLRLPTLGALLAVAVFVIMLGLGAVVLFWYVPTASIVLAVPVETMGDMVDIVVDTKVGDVDVAKGVVPARRREITVTRSLPGPATGTVAVPADYAGVGLVFANKTARAVTVPKGIVVQATSGMLFTIASDVPLAARVGASGEAIALAQKPGTAGNVPRNTVTRIDGPLADEVSVTNPAPGEKGTDIRQTAVSDNDVLFLRNLAGAYLADAAKKELLAQFADSETVFSDGTKSEVVDCTPIPPVGQAARYTEVSCTARVSMLTVLDEHLRRIYVDRFSGRIGADRMLLEDSFKTTVDQQGAFDATFDRLGIPVRVAVLAAPLVERARLSEALTGRSRASADRYLREQIDSPTPPTIDIPGWAFWLPRKADRIHIDVKPAPQAAQ